MRSSSKGSRPDRAARRLRPRPKVVLGLTGSIGMGKSHAARALERIGIPVFEADREVHRLIAPGGAAVGAVGDAFPGVVRDGGVDHGALAQRVFSDDDALDRLEAILHPMVHAGARRFLRRAARRGQDIVVLDVPLLFETGGERRCDATILVTAPAFLQAARVLGRCGMTRERFEAIRRRQMSEAEKERRADFVVRTGLSRGDALNRLRRIVTLVRRDMGRFAGRRRRPPGRRRAV